MLLPDINQPKVHCPYRVQIISSQCVAKAAVNLTSCIVRAAAQSICAPISPSSREVKLIERGERGFSGVPLSEAARAVAEKRGDGVENLIKARLLIVPWMLALV